MRKNNETFVKAHNRLYGNTLDCIEQLQKVTFEGDDIKDELVNLCEAYHLIKEEEKSFNTAGEYNFHQLELAFYKWTNPFFWLWAVFYGAYVLIKSLFVGAKHFSYVKK